MERLNFGDNEYIAIEGAIHLNRYLNAREICKGKKVLDLACGEGYGSFLMSEWGAKEVVGVDISKEAIHSANKNFKKDNIKFVNSNVEDLNFIEDNSFDLIVSFETIEHLSNPNLFLKEIKRVIRPEGAIIISCPNDYFYYPNEKEHNKYHMKKYTFNDFKKLTEETLGDKVQYMLGIYVGGYINTYPTIIKKSLKQDQMLEQELIKTVKISPDSDVKEDGSCYYIGFWNCKSTETATIYPYEYNELLSDYTKKIEFSERIYDVNKSLELEIEKYKGELKEQKQNNDQEIETYKHELKVQSESIEKEKKENMKKELLIELLNEENYILKDNINRYQSQEIELKSHLDSIVYSRTYKFSQIISKILKKAKFW